MTGVLAALAAARGNATPIAGNWDSIVGASGGTNANVTPTGFTGTRSIRISHDIVFGDLDYRIDSGTYTAMRMRSTHCIAASDEARAAPGQVLVLSSGPMCRRTAPSWRRLLHPPGSVARSPFLHHRQAGALTATSG